MSLKTRYINIMSKVANKVLGVAKNYTGDKAELAALRSREPVVFEKGLNSLTYCPTEVTVYKRGDILVEAELGLIIGKTGKDIALKDAMDYIGGYNLSVDFTDTRVMWYRQNGYSLTCAKSLDNYTPVGKFIDKGMISNIHNVDLSCKVTEKNETKLEFRGNSSQFVFSPAELIHFLSQGMTLNEGDIILSGTPTNAKVYDGQNIEVELAHKGEVLDKMKFDLSVKHIPEYVEFQS